MFKTRELLHKIQGSTRVVSNECNILHLYYAQWPVSDHNKNNSHCRTSDLIQASLSAIISNFEKPWLEPRTRDLDLFVACAPYQLFTAHTISQGIKCASSPLEYRVAFNDAISLRNNDPFGQECRHDLSSKFLLEELVL